MEENTEEKNIAEEKKEKLYYSINEVAQIFNVNASLLRFWEKEFTVIKPRKNAKGTRFYTKEDIDNIRLIYFLVKEKGMTLDGARKKIKENKKGSMKNLEIVTLLNDIKKQLQEIKNELDNLNTI